MRTAGIYIHYPWCERKCAYCDFSSFAAPRRPAGEFSGLILKELSLLPRSTETFDTVYFGGGTPSLLEAEDVAGIIEALKRSLTMTRRIEVSLEANPESLTARKLRAWRNAGVTRVSMGAQCLDDRILKYLSRLSNRRRVLKAASILADSGIGNFSFDLMFGLPGQTVDGFTRDMTGLMRFKPAHLSLYSLHVPPGSALEGKMKRDRISPPDDDSPFYDAACGLLKQEGFGHYEISNFNRPGRECRHNLHYWNYDSYLGLGPGAVGFLGNSRWTNVEDPEKYASLLGRNRLPRHPIETIDAATSEKEYLMMNLRKASGFGLGDFTERFGKDFMSRFGKTAEKLRKAGLLVCARGRVRIPERHFFVSNAVIREFFD